MRKAATIAIEPNAASGSFSATPISHPVMEDFDVRKRNIRLRNVRIYVTVQLYAVIDLVSTKLKRVMGQEYFSAKVEDYASAISRRSGRTQVRHRYRPWHRRTLPAST